MNTPRACSSLLSRLTFQQVRLTLCHSVSLRVIPCRSMSFHVVPLRLQLQRCLWQMFATLFVFCLVSCFVFFACEAAVVKQLHQQATPGACCKDASLQHVQTCSFAIFATAKTFFSNQHLSLQRTQRTQRTRLSLAFCVIGW